MTFYKIVINVLVFLSFKGIGLDGKKMWRRFYFMESFSDCGTILDSDHQSINYSLKDDLKTSFMSVAVLVCDFGYHIDVDSYSYSQSATCDKNGNWTHNLNETKCQAFGMIIL